MWVAPKAPAGMAEGNRETFGPRVGLSSHGSPAKGGPKSKCLPGEDRSDVGWAGQFNNIGPVPLSRIRWGHWGSPQPRGRRPKNASGSSICGWPPRPQPEWQKEIAKRLGLESAYRPTGRPPKVGRNQNASPGEDRSDVGWAGQFNNIGPVPLSRISQYRTCPAFRRTFPAFVSRFLREYRTCPAFCPLSRFLSRFPALPAFPLPGGECPGQLVLLSPAGGPHGPVFDGIGDQH